MLHTIPEIFQALRVEVERGYCQGCTLPVSERAYRVPRLPGVFCSITCIETELFRFERCRWCAEPIDRTYIGIESRLCGDDCRANYFAHVLGDHTAALGTGKRFLAWLQHHQPALYREIVLGNLPAWKTPSGTHTDREMRGFIPPFGTSRGRGLTQTVQEGFPVTVEHKSNDLAKVRQ